MGNVYESYSEDQEVVVEGDVLFVDLGLFDEREELVDLGEELLFGYVLVH